MSNNNFRIYANCIAEAQACKRDKYVEAHGICVTAMVPIDENEVEDENPVDYFGDPCVVNRKDKVMWLVPQYDNYYSLLSVMGEDLEDPIPLECLIKSTDHWPRETIFKLPVIHADGSVIDRYWKVLVEEGKHLEVYYSRKLQVVPARDHELEGIN